MAIVGLMVFPSVLPGSGCFVQDLSATHSCLITLVGDPGGHHTVGLTRMLSTDTVSAVVVQFLVVGRDPRVVGRREPRLLVELDFLHRLLAAIRR